MNTTDLIDQTDYYLASQRGDIVFFFKFFMPVEFFSNPLKLDLKWMPTLQGDGVILFLSGQEEKAEALQTLLSDGDINCFDEQGKKTLCDLLGYDCFDDVHSVLNERIGETEDDFDHSFLGVREGDEYDLMVSGNKDVSYFSGFVSVNFITNPRCLSYEFVFAPFSGVIIYKTGMKQKASLLFFLLRKSIGQFDEDIERHIGRLLGYSEKNIDGFIEHFKKQL